jgi:hypothetical protein
MMERTRMFSDSPGTPGRSMQTPRTIRSISTPACEASYSASITSGSTSEFILATMRALAAIAGDLGLGLDAGDDVRLQRERRLPQVLQRARLAQAGELLEDLADVTGDFLVGGHQAEVGVEAGGARVVVAGAEVGVALEAAFLAADDEQGLGVGLVADDAVDDMGADLFQLGRPADVGFLVEARHQFDDDGDFLAVLRGADQRFHQHRVGAGAVDGHLDRDHCGSVAAWLRNSMTGAKDW